MRDYLLTEELLLLLAAAKRDRSIHRFAADDGATLVTKDGRELTGPLTECFASATLDRYESLCEMFKFVKDEESTKMYGVYLVTDLVGEEEPGWCNDGERLTYSAAEETLASFRSNNPGCIYEIMPHDTE